MTFEAVRLGRYRASRNPPRPTPGAARPRQRRRRGRGRLRGGPQPSTGESRERPATASAPSAGCACGPPRSSRPTWVASARPPTRQARDARDIAALLDEMVEHRPRRRLVVSGDAIHPPDHEVRKEDTPRSCRGGGPGTGSRHVTRPSPRRTSRRRRLGPGDRRLRPRVGAALVPDGPWVPDAPRRGGACCPRGRPRGGAPGASPAGRRPRRRPLRRGLPGPVDRGHRTRRASGCPPTGSPSVLTATAASFAGRATRTPVSTWSGATRARWVDDHWEPVVPEPGPRPRPRPPTRA